MKSTTSNRKKNKKKKKKKSEDIGVFSGVAHSHLNVLFR